MLYESNMIGSIKMTPREACHDEQLPRVQYAHHRRIIERLRSRAASEPGALALLIIGSVARGEAFAGSDVDVLLVVDEAEHQRRVAANATLWDATDLVEAPAEGAGGEVIPLSVLRATAARGPEPARFAFVNAIVALTRDQEVERLVAAIPVYPEHEREEKLASFASQLPMHFSYMELADYSQNPYLLTDTAHELALFGGRLILAHNRLLYPGRKQFLRQLERAPEKPERFDWLLTRLLRSPSIPTAADFCEAVQGFQDWPKPPEGQLARYLRDRDKAWLDHAAALADS
jgi:predicted nucleotidyltransferase